MTAVSPPSPVPPSPVPRDWLPALPYALVGAALVLAGGLIAAVGSATEWRRAAWVAAYTVLVGGVAQIALGAGRVLLGGVPPSSGERWAELLGWNLGSAAVVVATWPARRPSSCSARRRWSRRWCCSRPGRGAGGDGCTRGGSWRRTTPACWCCWSAS
ncbi:MAG TPA: hypothetical protein VKP64_13990 [Mycobacteriales bacterium]|nr:hypothetical protein [Mycobacteriales bacterium]